MITDFYGKKILILGKGVSGLGAFEILKRKGACPTICDEDDLIDALNHKYDMVVISPSISTKHLIYEYCNNNKVELIGEIELGYRLTQKPIVAVTGTNGKTTVCDMCATLLNKKFSAYACGNIGVSFSGISDSDNDIFVVETSSFQMESTISFAPNVAVITNLAHDHIDRHGTYEKYVAEKLKIARNLKRCDTLILSYDDIKVDDLKGLNHDGKTVYVSIGNKVKGAYSLNGKIYWYDEYVCSTDRINLPYIHNEKNALFAVAVAKIFDVENRLIAQGLGEFKLRKHRLSVVDRIKSTTFYNDSKATNISATISAMRNMSSKYVLILGGSDKRLPFDDIFKINDSNLQLVLAVGQTAMAIKTTAEKYKIEVKVCSDLSNAVYVAFKSGVENVLFSPACASFDSFSSYAERGENFVRAVKELKKSEEER